LTKTDSSGKITFFYFKTISVKKLYFAYGSNMCQSRLEERVGKVTKIGTHRLEGYKLVFNAGYEEMVFANLEKTGLVKDFVEGVIYQLSPKQMRILDRYEGAPIYYNRVVEEGSLIVYICLNQSYQPYKNCVPSKEYTSYLLRGCKENNLKHAMKQLVELKEKKVLYF
jgi:hypothetical protein